MKKRLICFSAILFFGAVTITSASAADAEQMVPGIEELEENLPDGADEILGEVSIDGDMDTGRILGNILDSALGALGGIFKEAAGGAVAVLAAASLCSIGTSLAPPGTRVGDAISLAGVAVISAAAVSGTGSLISMASETMTETNAFSKALLPVLTSASAITGSAASAAAKYAASALFLDLLVTIGEKVILPLIYMYLAAAIASAAFGGSLSSVVRLIAGVVKFLLTAIAIIFTLFLTISGLVASTADAAAVKITKTAISTLLPVVGGMVSDAAEAVASSVAVIKSAAGVFGVLAVCAMCAIPFLKLAVNCIIFRLASALAEPVSDGRLTGLIGSVSSACGMALGLAGTSAIMLLISVLSVTRAVTGT